MQTLAEALSSTTKEQTSVVIDTLTKTIQVCATSVIIVKLVNFNSVLLRCVLVTMLTSK